MAKGALIDWVSAPFFCLAGCKTGILAYYSRPKLMGLLICPMLSDAIRFMVLDRRAFNCAVRAKHAAIPLLGFEQGAAKLAIIKKLAGIGWHGFRFGMTAVRAGDGRFENNDIHLFSSII